MVFPSFPSLARRNGPEKESWSGHAKRGFVHVDKGLFFADVVGFAFAKGDDFSQNLGVVAAPFGLGHDLFLLVCDFLFFGLKAFVALNELL
jgi:hypothetical protein